MTPSMSNLLLSTSSSSSSSSSPSSRTTRSESSKDTATAVVVAAEGVDVANDLRGLKLTGERVGDSAPVPLCRMGKLVKNNNKLGSDHNNI